MKQAIILAGGKGTRLASRLNGLPKPLIDVGGVPLLERQILLLKEFNFTNILILVNHLSEKIIDFCNLNNNWNCKIECIDDGEASGTAGAVFKILNKLEDEFLVVYGDTMIDVDLDLFMKYHQKDNTSACTIFLHPNDHPKDSDLVDMDENGYVTKFIPYPRNSLDYYPNIVNAALYLIRKEYLGKIEITKTIFDFGKDVFPAMLEKKIKIRGYNSFEYIKDIGTPNRIDKVNNDLKSGKIKRSRLSNKQKAIFLDRDGTINYEIDHLNSAKDFKLLPNVTEAIKIFNNNEFRVCVITNQPVVARGECTLSELKTIHNKMETLLGNEGAFIDKIKFCPHHPNSGFVGEVPKLKILCECRKPSIQLVNESIKEFNIDKKQSWFIGDTTTDILTAKNSNIRSILVKTGYAGLDNKYKITPDYTFKDIYEASKFITEGYFILKNKIEQNLKYICKSNYIFLGGQSKSGKTNFASLLSEVLSFYGKKVHIISTDRWLLSLDDRKENIYGRHDVKSLMNFMNNLINHKTSNLKMPFYIKKNRINISDYDSISINENDIVIFEGVIALAFSDLYPNAVRLYLEVNEDIRKNRIFDEYYSRKESDKMEYYYNSRLQDEFNIVSNTFINAIKILSK